MCFDHDSLPPVPVIRGAAVSHRRLELEAADGNRFAAFEALPDEPGRAAIVVLPDVRGLYRFYEELALRFAERGLGAVAIDYFGRTAGTGDRDADFDFRSHVQQTTPPQVATDIAAGVAHLRGRGRARAVFTVGFCFGGSYSFLQAANGDLGLSGVIGFYGGMRPRTEGGDSPITVAPRSQVPVLGLFGGADESIPTELVEQFRAGLVDSGVAHSVHVYPGAPHSFFDRSYAEHGQECADAWRRMLDFLSAHAPARNTT
jgi:carboxymethylenebutenolidase